MINYLIGDATQPQVENSNRIIAHVCNDKGGWGSGFVVALSKRWKAPEQKYRQWAENESFKLGEIQIVPVKDDQGALYVANMVAQHEYVSKDNPVAIRYDALAQCMLKLDRWISCFEMVKSTVDKSYLLSTTIHMPRIGCGLAGGNWDTVSPIISVMLNKYQVFVYDLPKDQERDDFDKLMQDIRNKKI